MAQRGTLVPPWYVSESPDQVIMDVCSIIWGFSMACAVFSASKAARQTWTANKRGKLLTAYPIMIWAEWLSSVGISVVCWLFLRGAIPPSFEVFFIILCLWTVQMNCIVQIIINRVALIMTNKIRARQLKISVLILIFMINISVFCIWIPARLQINDTYVRINDVWDRMEKAIFAVIDAVLNLFFMYTVRTKLIGNGLTKYKSLFQFNSMMVCVSLALDVILIGSMSIGTGVIYIQLHPLVYLVKLNIELNMAELIAKVVRASNPMNNIGNTIDITSAHGTSTTDTHGPWHSRRHSSHMSQMPKDIKVDLVEHPTNPQMSEVHKHNRASSERWNTFDSSLNDLSASKLYHQITQE